MKLIPHLRAFAFSIARRPEAEDLAQEAMLKAWRARASYRADTNFKAWVFTILRNHHMSIGRRAWRSTSLEPGVAESTLVANDNLHASEELVDVRNAMLKLPFEQRQALALVGAAGLSYMETAQICGCAEGTVKSRVSRARTGLLAILAGRERRQRASSDVSATDVFETLMVESADMQRATRTGASGQAAVALSRASARSRPLG